VAAASYFATVLGRQMPAGRCVVIYDFGGGTFDVAVVMRTADGFEVLASDGLPDVGGLDLDAAIVAYVRAATAQATHAWGRLDWPESPADRRARRLLWDDARAVKEQLSRHANAALHVPLAEADCHVTREEFEKLAYLLLDRTVAITTGTLRAAGVGRERVSGLFRVGGSSRVPLAASLLHRALGIASTIIEQPELVVASGAPHAVQPAIEAASSTLPPLSATGAPPTPPRSPAVAAPRTVRARPAERRKQRGRRRCRQRRQLAPMRGRLWRCPGPPSCPSRSGQGIPRVGPVGRNCCALPGGWYWWSGCYAALAGWRP
jgi:hypothetical protein